MITFLLTYLLSIIVVIIAAKCSPIDDFGVCTVFTFFIPGINTLLAIIYLMFDSIILIVDLSEKINTKFNVEYKIQQFLDWINT